MKKTITCIAVSCISTVYISCSQQQGAIEVPRAANSAFSLTSTAFTDNGVIPKECTCAGRNISPPLQWTDPPAGTKSYALVMEDPDAKPVVGYTWIHWVAYNIPPTSGVLKRGIPKTAKVILQGGSAMTQGITSFKSPGYGGPCPPEGTGTHHYHFTLYALNIQPGLPDGLTKRMLFGAIKGKIIGKATLTGTFEKK